MFLTKKELIEILKNITNYMEYVFEKCESLYQITLEEMKMIWIRGK